MDSNRNKKIFHGCLFKTMKNNKDIECKKFKVLNNILYFLLLAAE